MKRVDIKSERDCPTKALLKNNSVKDDESSEEDSEYYENDKKFLLNQINRNDDKPRRRKKEPEVKEEKVKEKDEATGEVVFVKQGGLSLKVARLKQQSYFINIYVGLSFFCLSVMLMFKCTLHIYFLLVQIYFFSSTFYF